MTKPYTAKSNTALGPQGVWCRLVASRNSMLSLIYANSSKQCKKFAKPELKVCIEEFEEKVSKVHEEKKEQEATTRNAEAHKQRIGSLDRILVNNEAGQNDGKSAEGKLNLFFFSEPPYLLTCALEGRESSQYTQSKVCTRELTSLCTFR